MLVISVGVVYLLCSTARISHHESLRWVCIPNKELNKSLGGAYTRPTERSDVPEAERSDAEGHHG